MERGVKKFREEKKIDDNVNKEEVQNSSGYGG